MTSRQREERNVVNGKKKPKKQMSYSAGKKPTSNIITQVPQNSRVQYVPPQKVNSFSPTNAVFSKSKLLPPKQSLTPKKTLVLDLDETLVHSSFTPFDKSDVKIELEMEGLCYIIHVLIRPGVSNFLTEMSNYFEIVIFTASLSIYASPLLDIIDHNKRCSYRLYREHCTFLNGSYIKDLQRLDRDLKNVIIVDNSPVAYSFHPENGLPIKSWFEDKADCELANLTPFLKFLAEVDDVRHFIPRVVFNNAIDYVKINQIIEKYKTVSRNPSNNPKKSLIQLTLNKPSKNGRNNLFLSSTSQNFNLSRGNNNTINNNNLRTKQKSKNLKESTEFVEGKGKLISKLLGMKSSTNSSTYGLINNPSVKSIREKMKKKLTTLESNSGKQFSSTLPYFHFSNHNRRKPSSHSKRVSTKLKISIPNPQEKMPTGGNNQSTSTSKPLMKSKSTGRFVRFKPLSKTPKSNRVDSLLTFYKGIVNSKEICSVKLNKVS